MRKHTQEIDEALQRLTESQKLTELQKIAERALDLQRNLERPLEVEEPMASRLENKATDKRNYRLQFVLTVGTWLAFGAAAIYAGLAHKQWKTMEKTYSEMHTQTGLIKQQLQETLEPSPRSALSL